MMESIRSKAAHLRLLVNRVDDRKELIDQVNCFFDEAISQLQARKADLLRDVRSHSVDADSVKEVADEVEQLVASLPTAAASTLSPMHEAERQLDACLSREAHLLQIGRFDSRRAEKRVKRLMDCLKVDWRDEWSERRQADNPFASVDDDEGEEAESSDEDDEAPGPFALGAGEYEIGDAGKVKASAYHLPGSVDFGSVLQAAGREKHGDDSHVHQHDMRKKQKKHQASEQQQFKQPSGRKNSLPNYTPEVNPLYQQQQPQAPRITNRPASIASAFDTRGCPASVGFLHGSFYVLERQDPRDASLGNSGSGGVVRVYDRRGRFKHPMPLRMFGSSPVRVHRIRVCHQRVWLLLIDRDASKVHCVRSNGTLEHSFEPAVSKRFSISRPEDALCTGDLLFICCPTVGIFILALPPQQQQQQPLQNAEGGGTFPSADKDADDPNLFRVTQSNICLGLKCPVRLSWNYANRWLLVVDREAPDSGQYSVHRFRFERSGISSRLIRDCVARTDLEAPVEFPPLTLTFKGLLVVAMRDADGAAARIMKVPASSVFEAPAPASQHSELLRWVCQASACGWAITDACYMSSQEFAVSDSHGICILTQ